MPTPTYDPIASTTLASSASSVTFSSLDTIAAGYRDLVLICGNLNSDTGSNSLRLRINGDTSSLPPSVHASGDGSSTYSFTSGSVGFSQLMGAAGLGTADNNTTIVQFFDFAATDKHKSYLVRTNQAGNNVEMVATRYPQTTAITSLLIYLSANNFAAGSTFSLYGISA